jgi:hypothetical protein
MMRLQILLYAPTVVMLVLAVARGGSTGDTGSGTTPASEAKPALALPECMRSHGVTDFPDPTFSAGGGIAQSAATRINRNSPAFQRAVAVCNRRSS